MGQDRSFEASVQAAWRALTEEALPRAARARGWSLRDPAAFRGAILDAVGARPEAPGLFDLVLAVEFGAGLLDGTVSVDRLAQAAQDARPRGERRRLRG